MFILPARLSGGCAASYFIASTRAIRQEKGVERAQNAGPGPTIAASEPQSWAQEGEAVTIEGWIGDFWATKWALWATKCVFVATKAAL